MFKTILLLIISSTLLIAQSLDNLLWLEGKWKVQTERAEIYEEWKLKYNELVGLGYTVKDDTKVISEHLVIKLIGEKVVFIASPIKQTPTLFNLIKTEGESFTFENLEHDFPQKIIYTKISDDEFNARVEGKQNGEQQGFDIKFFRWHNNTADKND